MTALVVPRCVTHLGHYARVGCLLALVTQGGSYNLLEAGVGVLAVIVGTVLAANCGGSATRLRDHRARWGRIFGGPIWFWRAWGGFIALCGVMAIIQ